jgi:hypothetical protein
MKGRLWPDSVERSILSRFYWAIGVSEALNVIFPFQFVYLYLVLNRPEWAPIPLLIESATYILLEIPSGLFADRRGRKRSVTLGYGLGAFAWAMVPLAVSQPGILQLLSVCTCFMVGGIAGTLVSGAREAWVVDNLAHHHQSSLVETYFARSRSFQSLGSTFAASMVLLALYIFPISRTLLDMLWLIMATGMLATAAILSTIPEISTDGNPYQMSKYSDAEPFKAISGFRLLLKRPLLFMFFLVMVIGTFAGSIANEAFDISLVMRGMDARAFAALGIADNLVWIIAPMAGLYLARRFSLRFVLVLFLILPAITMCVFFFQPALWGVVGLYLLLDLFDGIWDPLAEARLHALIPSHGRATLASIVNQVSGLVEILGIGLFALMLGEHSDALRDAAPGLLEAFSGGTATLAVAPEGFMGIPIPDQAIIIFVLSGLFAVPFILKSVPKENNSLALRKMKQARRK